MVAFILFALVAFISGFLSFLSPCTLPLLPAYFACVGTSQRSKIAVNTLFFSLGLALMFTSLGVLAASLGRFTFTYKRELLFLTGLLFFFFGFFSIAGKTFTIKNSRVPKSRLGFGAFLFGGLFGLTWSGCIGPIVGFMLILAANVQTALAGGLLLFIHALGILLPLIVFSLLASRLPQTGKFWKCLRGKLLELKIGKKIIYIHSTNIITGALFLLVGALLMTEDAFGFTKFIFPQITGWIFSLQTKLAEAFGVSL